MNTYSCPDWLRRRRISDCEYAAWLEKQTNQIWNREAQKRKRAFATRQALKLALHQAASESTGYDPYSGARFFVKHIRKGWVDNQAHLKGNRHYRTLRRCMPSFDHVNGLGKKAYELCTRETNSAKSFMSPAQFLDLCRRVTEHHKNRLLAGSLTVEPQVSHSSIGEHQTNAEITYLEGQPAFEGQ